MKKDNTVKVRFLKDQKDLSKGVKNKEYKFHLPKYLRNQPISIGTVVVVESRNYHGKKKAVQKAVVSEVFREEIEDTGLKYQPVIQVLKVNA